MVEDQLKPCTCGYKEKLKATLVFGYMTITCPNCGRKLTGEARSGSSEYILENGLLNAWNRGDVDEI